MESMRAKFTSKIKSLEAERDRAVKKADKWKGKAALLEKKLGTVKLQVDEF
jgi:hypothetical protein